MADHMSFSGKDSGGLRNPFPHQFLPTHSLVAVDAFVKDSLELSSSGESFGLG
jgi:hypothetical protein